MKSSPLWPIVFLILATTTTVLLPSPPAVAEDKEDCLMCHKYRFLGRIDENGKKFNYNVDEHIYPKSIHRHVPCRDCHTSIDKIPHDPITQPVNCANTCHLKPPHASENFSHEKIIGIFKESAHGVRPGDSELLKNAKPNCKFCHVNPIYTRVEERLIDYDKTLARCMNCHEKKGVTQAYTHVTHRLRRKTTRSPQEIVALCAKCHQDRDMLKKLNVSEESMVAVETYKRSIHGKSVTLGSEKAADCISCHASPALHDIYKKENKKATINGAHLMTTCRQCHEKTNSWFVKIAVHPRIEREENPMVYFASIFFRLALYGSLLSMVGLMLVETVGRRRDGIKLLLKNGTTWREKSKRRRKK